MIINKKEIRDSLTAEQIIKIMNKLGCSEYEDHDNYIQFKSICHNIDENEAGLNLSYYKDSHRFYCFSNCIQVANCTNNFIINSWCFIYYFILNCY